MMGFATAHTVSLEPSARRWNVASRSLIYTYYFGRCLPEFPKLGLLYYYHCTSSSNALLANYSPRCYKGLYVYSLFYATTRFWNSLKFWFEYWINHHFLLHCPLFHGKRHTLGSTLINIDSKLLECNDSYLTQTLLFGSTSFDSETKTLVLNATINYILSTEKFEEPLLFNPFRSTFFVLPDTSVPGDCDFLVYCVILYINIFVHKKNSLSVGYFPSKSDLKHYKFRNNRHLSFFGSF